MLSDLVFGLEPGDRARLLDVQTQGVARLRSSLVGNALGVAMHAAGRAHSPVAALQYLWESPQAYVWMQELTDNFDRRADELIEGILALRDVVADPQRWTWSFTGSDAAFSTFETKLHDWQARAASTFRASDFTLEGTLSDGEQTRQKVIGLAAPLDVQFCTQSLPLPEPGRLPLVDLGVDLLRHDYLLPEIRFKGNAYGAGFSLNEASGLAAFYSYRDPNLNETLRVFETGSQWVADQQWTDIDIERALLGNSRDAIPAIRPDEATARVLLEHVRGETPEMRAGVYQKKLAATPQQVQGALTEYFEQAEPHATVAVAASREALENANLERTESGKTPFEIQEMLP